MEKDHQNRMLISERKEEEDKGNHSFREEKIEGRAPPREDGLQKTSLQSVCFVQFSTAESLFLYRCSDGILSG